MVSLVTTHNFFKIHSLVNVWTSIRVIFWHNVSNLRYAVVLIAMYNVGDLIGRYIPLLKFFKLESRKYITAATLSRFLLVPAFYFTAKYGDQGWMIMLTSFLGLSNGYLTVCVLTAAPKGYKVCPIHIHLKVSISWEFFKPWRLINTIGFHLFVGTRAKCTGKFACVVSIRWYLRWCYTWLAVAYRQRMVRFDFGRFQARKPLHFKLKEDLTVESI